METTTTIAQHVGARIATLRKRKGKTQAGLGKLVGCNRQRICNYEAGRVLPRVDLLARIAAALGVSLDAIA